MIFNPKSITDFNQFEGTIWAKYNIMEKICQKYDFGFKGEEILKKHRHRRNVTSHHSLSHLSLLYFNFFNFHH